MESPIRDPEPTIALNHHDVLEEQIVSDDVDTTMNDYLQPSDVVVTRAPPPTQDDSTSYYDEEVASDSRLHAYHVDSTIIIRRRNHQGPLDESALEHTNHRSSSSSSLSRNNSSVKFSRQLTSPTSFKLRRLNMAGMMISTVDDNSSPPGIFTNSWSFGSSHNNNNNKSFRGLDGVVDDEEDGDNNEATMGTKMKEALQARNKTASNLPRVQSTEFNLDLIELAHTSSDEHTTDAMEKQKVDDEDTDLQTDSEEMRDSDENGMETTMMIHHEDDFESNGEFHRLPEYSPSDDEDVGEFKSKHFVWRFVVLWTLMIVIPLVVVSMKPKKKSNDTVVAGGSTNHSISPSTAPSSSHLLQFGEMLPSTMPSLAQPTRSRMPSQSYSPSNLPSILPSRSPSTEPTRPPSTNPTASPSSIPSISLVPSIQPSMEPSTKPSNGPTDNPSVYPTSQPSPVPTGLPTNSLSPTQLTCEVHTTDGCEDYYYDYHHPTGWANNLSCTVSNAFLTCSISSCFDIRRPGDWPSWELFLTNAVGDYFRIRHNHGGSTQTAATVVLEQRNLLDGISWTAMGSYPVKPSASEVVFGIPIGSIPHLERLRTWLVSYDENGMDMDRIPRVGNLLFTGAGDFCS